MGISPSINFNFIAYLIIFIVFSDARAQSTNQKAARPPSSSLCILLTFAVFTDRLGEGIPFLNKASLLIIASVVIPLPPVGGDGGGSSVAEERSSRLWLRLAGRLWYFWIGRLLLFQVDGKTLASAFRTKGRGNVLSSALVRPRG